MLLSLHHTCLASWAVFALQGIQDADTSTNCLLVLLALENMPNVVLMFIEFHTFVDSSSRLTLFLRSHDQRVSPMSPQFMPLRCGNAKDLSNPT